MLTIDPRVAVNGAWPSISTFTSPSTTANHSRVSGCNRFGAFAPGAAATYSPVSRPSSTSTSRQLASPLCLALTSPSLFQTFCPGGYAGGCDGFGAQTAVGIGRCGSCASSDVQKEPPRPQRPLNN